MESLTSRAIGQHCGIPERTIRDWQAKGIVPKTQEMAIAVQAIIAHYKQQIKEIAESSGDDDMLKAEKIRLTRAQADKVELELSVRQGELVEVASAEREWSNLVAAFRARMLTLPPKAAAQVVGVEQITEIEALLRDFVYEALLELSEYKPVTEAETLAV